MTKRWVDRSIEAAALGILRTDAIVHNGWQFALNSAIAANGVTTKACTEPPDPPAAGGSRRLVSTAAGLCLLTSYPTGPMQLWISPDGFEAYEKVWELASGERMAHGFDTLIDCGRGRMIIVEYGNDTPDALSNTERIWYSSDYGQTWDEIMETAVGAIRHFHSGHYDPVYDYLIIYTGDTDSQSSMLYCDDIDDLGSNPGTWKARWGLGYVDRQGIDEDYVIGWNAQRWRVVVGGLMGDYFYWGSDTNANGGIPMNRFHRRTLAVETVHVMDHSAEPTAQLPGSGNMVGECWGAGIADTGEFLTIGYGHVKGYPYWGDTYRHLYMVDPEEGGLIAREIQRTSILGPNMPYQAALAYSIHTVGDFTIVSDYYDFSVSLAGNVSDEEGSASVFTSLAALSSGAASHGKNFQQFFDGGSGGYRSGAYTDLVELASIITRYSGNTFTNLLALANRLAVAPDIEDELNHTSSTLRAAAASEMGTLVTDFNALEVAEGVSPTDLSGLTVAFNRCLGSGAPNSMGAWSERLTAAQITAANVAMSAIASHTGLAHWLNNPSLLLMPEHGVTYDGTGTGTGGGVGISALVNKGSVAATFVQPNDKYQPGYWPSRLNGYPTFHFPVVPGSVGCCLYTSGVPIFTATTGYIAFIIKIFGTTTNRVIFSQGSDDDANHYIGPVCLSTEKVGWLAKNGATTYSSTTYVQDVLNTNWHLHEFIKDETGLAKFYLDGILRASSVGDVDIWFGDLAENDRSCFGGMGYNILGALPFQGEIGFCIGFDGWNSVTNATQIAAVRAALQAKYGLA